MIRRMVRSLTRLAVITAVGYGVGKLIEAFREASDPSRPARAEPWRPALPADPIKVEGDALLAPHGESALRTEAEPVMAAAEKPPQSRRPRGSADPATKAPAAKKAQAPKARAPRKDDAGEA